MIQEETKRNEISITGYSTDTKLRYIASQVVFGDFANRFWQLTVFVSWGTRKRDQLSHGSKGLFFFFLFSLDLLLFMAMKATLGARGFFCSEAAIVQLRYKKKIPSGTQGRWRHKLLILRRVYHIHLRGRQSVFQIFPSCRTTQLPALK